MIKHIQLPLNRYHEACGKVDNELFIAAFVAEMNKYVKLLKVDENTWFTNPHGLSDKNNHSSPADVCRIAAAAMRFDVLKEIVSKRFYECTVIS